MNEPDPWVLYPSAPTQWDAVAMMAEAVAFARAWGGESLAGWELVGRKRDGTLVEIRILADQVDRLPEAISEWLAENRPIGPEPDPAWCRVYTLEFPAFLQTHPTDGPRTTSVYDSRDSGPVAQRLLRAIDPRGLVTFVGLRPPSESYWQGLPVPGPGSPAGASEAQEAMAGARGTPDEP